MPYSECSIGHVVQAEHLVPQSGVGPTPHTLWLTGYESAKTYIVTTQPNPELISPAKGTVYLVFALAGIAQMRAVSALEIGIGTVKFSDPPVAESSVFNCSA